MQTIKCNVNQISKDLILEDGDIKIQLCSPAGGHVLAVPAERSYWDDDLGDEVIEKVDVREALDELLTFFHKDNCYQPNGSVAAEIDGEWYTIIYKVDGGYAGIQIV